MSRFRGKHLYASTVGKFGFLLGIPLFLLCYTYAAGIFLTLFFEGFSTISIHILLNPLKLWQNFLNYWQLFLANTSSLGWMFLGKVLAASFIPLLFLRLVLLPARFIMFLLRLPLRGMEKSKLQKEKEQFTQEIVEMVKKELQEEENKKKEEDTEQ